MPFCRNCGHDNPEGSNFCGQCGSALRPVSVASPSSQVIAVQSELGAPDPDR